MNILKVADTAFWSFLLEAIGKSVSMTIWKETQSLWAQWNQRSETLQCLQNHAQSLHLLQRNQSETDGIFCVWMVTMESNY